MSPNYRPSAAERQTTHFLRRPLKSSASQNLRGSPINAKRSQTRDAPPFHIPPPTAHQHSHTHTCTHAARPPGPRSPVALWEPVGGLWKNASRRMQKPGTPVPMGCNGQSPNRPKNRFPIQGKDMRRLGLALRPACTTVTLKSSRYCAVRRGPPNPLEQCSSRLPGSLLHLSGEGRHFSHARRLTFESKHASSP
ncbi:hypothetical protein CSAL01_01727 [Colletotrichum salicis]|uniref:Uncharacterized protein n=1 Tax=Colletotrichum salicis TaxID=1209931 RepID=A0A135V915_9PEZI|nr:hypothetical protein CSAL01_01727 [Colletotrichum salicis]